MTNKKMLEVTLISSLIGRKPKHKLTVRGLGLTRRDKPVQVEDTPAVRGMINQVSYLLKVTEV